MKVLLLSVSCFLCGLLLPVWPVPPQAAEPGSVEVEDTGPPLIQLEELSELTTLRVQVATILTGKLGSVEGVFLIQGDALLSTDLSKAEVMEQDPVKRTLRIQLPEPQVLSPRVDHERTRCCRVDRGWAPASYFRSEEETTIRDEAMQKAQALIARIAGSNENTIRARDDAARTLTVFLEHLGWCVTLEFREEAS